MHQLNDFILIIAMYRVISFVCTQRAIDSYAYSRKLQATLQLRFNKRQKIKVQYLCCFQKWWHPLWQIKLIYMLVKAFTHSQLTVDAPITSNQACSQVANSQPQYMSVRSPLLSKACTVVVFEQLATCQKLAICMLIIIYKLQLHTSQLPCTLSQ